jgi:predicted RNase H-like nuclease (RuvC/YqgF family)
MNADLDSENNAKSSGKDLKKEFDTMAALQFQISTLEQTVAENMTTITRLRTQLERMQMRVYADAFKEKVTFCSRGSTGLV